MAVKLFQSVHSEQLLPEHARDLLQVFLLPGKLNVDEEVQMKYLRTKHALSAANTQWTNDANLEPRKELRTEAHRRFLVPCTCSEEEKCNWLPLEVVNPKMRNGGV